MRARDYRCVMLIRRSAGLLLLACAALLLTGCTLSRAEQLARQSERVETKLLRECDRVTAAPSTPDTGARLSHLTDLRTQLTVADAARKLAPRLLQEPEQIDAAYDVLEEVYSTIDWNIPLLPGDRGRKALPSVFGPAGLDFSRIAPASAGNPAN